MLDECAATIVGLAEAIGGKRIVAIGNVAIHFAAIAPIDADAPTSWTRVGAVAASCRVGFGAAGISGRDLVTAVARGAAILA